MKSLLYSFFIFGIIHPVLFAKESLTYRITAGQHTATETFHIVKTENGYRIESAGTIWELNNDLSQICWNYADTESGDRYTAARRENVITLDGIFKNKSVKKHYTIDNDVWSQCAHFFLTGFAESGKKESVYWFISPYDLAIYKIKALRMKGTDITVNGKAEQGVRIRIAPTGFAGNFWHGDYWFRADDKLYVRYEAVHGPPGTPVTVKELIEEKKRTNH
jgi:hypothetical protein